MFTRRICLLFPFLGSTLLVFATPTPRIEMELESRVTHSGRGTWFHPGQGNCGKWNNDNDKIVAISKSLYDRTNGVNCDQWVQITNQENGKVAYGRTRDSCEDCKDTDLDMSPSLFKQLEPIRTGNIHISWHFMNHEWSP